MKPRWLAAGVMPRAPGLDRVRGAPGKCHALYDTLPGDAAGVKGADGVVQGTFAPARIGQTNLPMILEQRIVFSLAP